MYTAHFLSTPVPAEEAWSRAAWSPRFRDMVTGAPALLETRASMLWNDEALFVRFDVSDPYPEARLTERDSLIFLENDVELFIDGGDCYYEFEVNALGTIYEVFFIWQDTYPRFAGEFDVFEQQALSFGGDYDRTGETFWRGTHPRGLRWAFRHWDFPGLQCKVTLDGALNDPEVVSRGWRADVALPWSGMRLLANGRPLPPAGGDEWRFFLGRFQKLVFNGREVQPHPAWCWTPHGVYDTHRPECWTPVRFSRTPV